MVRIITKWFISALSLLLAAYLVPGIEVEGFYIALIVAVVLGIVNIVLKPIFLILTLPVNILTLGLFTFVVNALLFWFVASFVDGFRVEGFIAAFWGALIVSVGSFLANKIV